MTKSSDSADFSSGRIVWWLLGIASAIAIAVSGAWAKNTSQRLERLEPVVTADHQANEDIQRRLVRIENKLDKALEKR